MGEIRLNHQGYNLIRDILRDECKDPEKAKEIMEAMGIMGVPPHKFMSMILQDDVTEEEFREMHKEKAGSE